MPSTVERINPTRVKLTIEMPFAELKPSIDKAYAEIAQQVNLPGFRKGKVPPNVIDQRFGRGTVLQEAINEALPNAYGQAIADNKLAPLGQPEVEVTKLEDGDVVEFTAEVDVRPEFDLPEFNTLKATVPTASVDDADVAERLEMLRERFATTTEVDRAAQEGDVVVVDLEGKQDGETLDDASAEGISFKIGSGNMLEGLDEAVTGKKAGESATFTSTLLGGAHRGEQAEITVTLQKVQEQELPEVDDEFAQMVSQFDTADEMKNDLTTSLENMERLQQAATARDKVLEDLLSKVEIELPQTLVDAEIEARKEQISQQLAQAGLTIERYLDETEEEDAKTPEEFWAEVEKNAVDALKAQIVLDKLADDREFGVSQEELTQLIFRKAQENGTSPDREAQHMMEHNHMADWMQEIRRGKALQEIVTAATITDEAGATVDLENLNPDGSVNTEAQAEKAEAEQADAAEKKPAKKPAARKTAAKKADGAKADDANADDAKAEAAEKKPARKPAARKTAAKKADDTKADQA